MFRIRRRHRVLGAFLFVLYLFGLAYFLFFAEALGRAADIGPRSVNLTPFLEIRRFWNYRGQVGMKAFFLNTAGNVLAFVPFGFFMPLTVRPRRGLIGSLLGGAAFSLAIETVQFLTSSGSFDVDDIILNTCGSVLGYILFRICFSRQGSQ